MKARENTQDYIGCESAFRMLSGSSLPQLTLSDGFEFEGMFEIKTEVQRGKIWDDLVLCQEQRHAANPLAAG